MFATHLGEIAALGTAFCWTATAMSFEAAGKRVGSLSVNLIRLWIGFAFLCLFCWYHRGLILPIDADTHNWIYLALSVLIGFLIGDLLLFKAFVVVGSRVSMLVMASGPPLTAILGWLIMGEALQANHYPGMALTVTGIILVVMERGNNHKARKHPLSGVLLAFGGAFGQALGLVLSKYGMRDYSPFAATQIRIIAGIIGFSILFTLLKRWPRILLAVHNTRAMTLITTGSFFGPFLGVSLSLMAVKFTETGVACTIMSIVPVLIIPPAVLLYHEKVTLKEVIGALLSVTGVSVMFL